MLADPQLLTCLTWEATEARLYRTGVWTAPPRSEGGGDEEAARKRAPLPPGKTGSVARVKTPQRHVKTVQGAAAVAAAIAQARPAAKAAK